MKWRSLGQLILAVGGIIVSVWFYGHHQYGQATWWNVLGTGNLILANLSNK